MEQPHQHPMDESQRLLKVGIMLTFAIFLLEFFGGLATHSLALMSDAWHIFIDIWALVLSFLAFFVAQRPADERRTFGLHRMEVFAATVNGFTVFFIAIGILYAAWRRLNHPVAVRSLELLWIAGAGLALNLVVAGLFYERSQMDSNIRGAFLHVLGDDLGTLAVMLAAGLMIVTKSLRIDAVVSALIA